MPTYRARDVPRRPRLGLVYDDSITATEIITAEGESDTFTGLYDAHGTPLYRERSPLGFDTRRKP